MTETWQMTRLFGKRIAHARLRNQHSIHHSYTSSSSIIPTPHPTPMHPQRLPFRTTQRHASYTRAPQFFQINNCPTETIQSTNCGRNPLYCSISRASLDISKLIRHQAVIGKEDVLYACLPAKVIRHLFTSSVILRKQTSIRDVMHCTSELTLKLHTCRYQP